MKSMLTYLAVGVIGAAAVHPISARAELEVGVSFQIHATSDFHAHLERHGAWIEVGSYGHCWRPAHVAVGWRPYGAGRWVWTDCGWYWESDEPWAWACYHYGNWVDDPDYGWIWIPGIEWSPAWVSWRVGGGYIGWSPLEPAHLRVAVRTPAYVFVETARFHERHRPSRVIVNNTTIINQTTVINNVRREERSFAGAAARPVVVNEGPGVDAVQKAAHKKFKPVPIGEAARQTAAPAALRRGNRTANPHPAVSPSNQPGNQRAHEAAPNRPVEPSVGRERVAPSPSHPPTETQPSDKTKSGRPAKGKRHRSAERDEDGRGNHQP